MRFVGPDNARGPWLDLDSELRRAEPPNAYSHFVIPRRDLEIQAATEWGQPSPQVSTCGRESRVANPSIVVDDPVMDPTSAGAALTARRLGDGPSSPA